MANPRDADNPKVEPCLSCGEETAVGSVFFSDRHEGVGPDGQEFFVCSECLKPVKLEEHYVDMSDPEIYWAVTAAAQFTFRDSSF